MRKLNQMLMQKRQSVEVETSKGDAEKAMSYAEKGLHEAEKGLKIQK